MCPPEDMALPIEAVLGWPAVMYATVLVYEAMKAKARD